MPLNVYFEGSFKLALRATWKGEPHGIVSVLNLGCYEGKKNLILLDSLQVFAAFKTKLDVM